MDWPPRTREFPKTATAQLAFEGPESAARGPNWPVIPRFVPIVSDNLQLCQPEVGFETDPSAGRGGDHHLLHPRVMLSRNSRNPVVSG